MQNRYFRLSALCSAVLLVACDSSLAVTNPNVVDVDAAFKTPQGIQQVIGKSFQGIFQGQYASLDAVMPQAMNSSGESASSLANSGMGLRTGIPRPVIDTQLGNTTFLGNFRDFSFFTRFARQAANGIKALRGLNRPDLETAKARALGFFVLGYAEGNMALMYDSAAVIRPDTTDEATLLRWVEDHVPARLPITGPVCGSAARSTAPRTYLARVDELSAQYPQGEVPRPPH